jgi:hypothetical protein
MLSMSSNHNTNTINPHSRASSNDIGAEEDYEKDEDNDDEEDEDGNEDFANMSGPIGTLEI